jgi:hypothetical protein
MKKVIKNNAHLFPISYLYTEITKYEIEDDVEQKEVVLYVKSEFYQTEKYASIPFYKLIAY